MTRKTLSTLLFFTLLFSSLVYPVQAQIFLSLNRTEVGETSQDFGYAIYLDGDDDYGEVLDQDEFSINYTGSFSIECWFNHYHVDDYTTVMHKSGEWMVYPLAQSEYVYWHNYLEVEGYGWRNTGPESTHEKLWHYYVGESHWNGTHLFLYLYVNATLTDSNIVDCEPPDEILPQGSGNLKFGGSWTVFYHGYLDEIRIWNRLLNTTEQEYAFNNGEGRYDPLNSTGLISQWHLNDGSGTNLYDSISGYNGTLKNPDGDEWVTGHVPYTGPMYPENILVTNLAANYEVRLYNGASSIANATVSSGVAALTLSSEYREDTFEGTFKIFDGDGDHVFTEVFEDTRGGDEYEAIEEAKPFVFASAMIGVFLIVMVCLPILLVTRRRRRR